MDKADQTNQTGCFGREAAQQNRHTGESSEPFFCSNMLFEEITSKMSSLPRPIYTCQFQGPAPNRYPQIPPSTRSRVRCCHLPARPRRRTYSPDTGRPSSTLIRVMPNRYPHQGCLKPACQGDPHRWLAGWLLGGPTG